MKVWVGPTVSVINSLIFVSSIFADFVSTAFFYVHRAVPQVYVQMQPLLQQGREREHAVAESTAFGLESAITLTLFFSNTTPVIIWSLELVVEQSLSLPRNLVVLVGLFTAVVEVNCLKSLA